MANPLSAVASLSARVDRAVASSALFSMLRNLLVLRFILAIVGARIWTDVRRFGPLQVLRDLVTSIRVAGFGLLRRYVPAVGKEVDTAIRTNVEQIDAGMSHPAAADVHLVLPRKGLDRLAVTKILERYQEMDKIDFAGGRVTAAVFHERKELKEIGVEAISRYLSANALHADIFQSTRQMEAEIVSMTLRLFNAGPDGCGVHTSGGTESLTMAIKAYRDKARAQRGITDPEIICPSSIHPAVPKACHLFNVRCIRIPVDATSKRGDVDAMRRAVSRNTIAIFGSAPSWPYGAVDDFPALGKIALDAGIGLHVDSCLGGFVLPFMEEAGFPISTPFDFRVPGVTSISADVHKAGLAPKGNSVIMYSHPSIRRYQFFTLVEYCGGLYASPSFSGTRPGMLIAACYATMISIGREGYVEVTKSIIETAREIREKVPTLIPEAGWFVFGDAPAHVVAFGATKVNPLAVLDALGKKGWQLGGLQEPSGLQIAVTTLTVGHVEELLRDFEECTRLVMTDPEAAKGGQWASMYGAVKNVPDTRIVGEIVEGYLAAMYKPL
ncbi:putative sphingosine-1-phosphate lyase [Hyaloraphidium curvatum]|nr:putative sphingosine-1-phosphate lyase [Hyaloraphidium curvatum]